MWIFSYYEQLKQSPLSPINEEIELHKPCVGQIKLHFSHCDGGMTRTSEVIDVWFDSGSMPFAQYHYPFENKELFEK